MWSVGSVWNTQYFSKLVEVWCPVGTSVPLLNNCSTSKKSFAPFFNNFVPLWNSCPKWKQTLPNFELPHFEIKDFQICPISKKIILFQICVKKSYSS